MTEDFVNLVLANVPTSGAVSVTVLQAQLTPGLGPDDDPADVYKALEELEADGAVERDGDGWVRVEIQKKPKVNG